MGTSSMHKSIVDKFRSDQVPKPHNATPRTNMSSRGRGPAPRGRIRNTNIHINGTGQAPVLFQMPDLIDADTPDDAKTRTGFDGNTYNLVFSDEFNTDGRTFYPGDDPYWEAVDLWYWATSDMEWYDPGQVFTRDGKLVILIEEVETHDLQYRSGMLQSWNKFCFTSGYIEVSLSLPGPNEDASGYVSLNDMMYFHISS